MVFHDRSAPSEVVRRRMRFNSNRWSWFVAAVIAARVLFVPVAHPGEPGAPGLIPLPSYTVNETATYDYLTNYFLSNAYGALRSDGGDYQARDFMTLALRNNPRDPRILQAMSHIEERLGNWREVSRLLTLLAELSPGDSRIPGWAAYADAKLGKFEQAKAAYRNVFDAIEPREAKAAIENAFGDLDAMRREMSKAARSEWDDVRGEVERLEGARGWNDLEDLADSIIERQPFNGMAYLTRGTARMRLRHMAEATVDFEEALARDLPAQAIVRAEAALVEIREAALAAEDWETVVRLETDEDWEGLEKHLSNMIRRRPDDGAAVSSRGFVRHRRGELPGARDDFATALSLDLEPDTRYAVRHSLDQLERQSEEAADWTRFRERVSELERANDGNGLEALYSREIAANPGNAAAVLGRAFVRQRMGALDAAEADFRNALALDTDEESRAAIAGALSRLNADRAVMAEWNRVRTRVKELEERESWSELEEFYTRELETKADNVAAMIGRGFVRQRLGRTDAAAADFRAALALGPDSESRAAVESSLAWLEAERLSAEAGRLSSAEWREFQDRVRAFESAEDWSGLERFYSGELEKNPGNTAAMIGRAFVRERLGRSAEAEFDFLASLGQDLDSATKKIIEEHIAASAQARKRAGDWAEASEQAAILEEGMDWRGAEEVYDRFLAEHPGHAWAHVGRGYARATLGRSEEALADFSAAVNGDLDAESRKTLEDSVERLRIDLAEGRTTANPKAAEMLPKIGGFLGEKRPDAAAALLAKIESLPLSPDQRGVSLFYKGEIARNAGDSEQAFRRYLEAAPLLREDHLLSDALWRIAEYYRGKKDREAATAHARRSVSLAPDNPWRNIEAGLLFSEFRMYDEAVCYMERGLASGGVSDPEVYFMFPALAAAYNQRGQRERYLGYTRRYIDAAGARLAAESAPACTELTALYEARRAHSLQSRRFGGSLSMFYGAFDNGDYMVQSYNEFFYNLGTFRNVGVEAYLYAIGTWSRFSGVYYEPTLLSNTVYEGSSGLADTFHVITGVRLRPPILGYGLTLGIERVIKIGRDTYGDTRLRAVYSRDFGFELKPCLRNWLYAYTSNDLIYSTRKNDFTFWGDQRLGRSFLLDRVDDRLAVSPFVGVTLGYGGKNVPSSQRFSVEAGPGLHFRKWYREDKYNAPRSTFDVIVQYRFGLTHRRNDAFCISVTTSF